MPNRSAQTLWETVLGQLELQVTRPNFETWLRNTVGLRMDESQLVVGVPSDFAVEWLRSRMSSLINRTVSQLLDSPVSISFQVLGAQLASAALTSTGGQPTAASTLPRPDLNPHFTFQSFTAVKSNRLAYRAARRVASADSSYNPLVLFGAPGLGKTHLLHAIGQHAAHAGRRVVALTGEEFVDRYGKAVRAGHPHTFRDQFEDCEFLLLDDLPFLATRTASQEQFFHTFNTLHAADCYLVITLDAHPDTLAGLSPRLRSRLLAGLSIELLPPAPSERLEILLAKAAHLTHPLTKPILQLIAEQPYQNIRELEGALNRVAAYADLTDTPLSPATAQRALQPLLPPHQEHSPDTILQTVCSHFHLSLELLASPSRARDITYARHIAIYLLRQYTQRPLAEIGQLFGGRDHSTILNGYQRIHQELTSLPQTRTDVHQLETALQNQPAA